MKFGLKDIKLLYRVVGAVFIVCAGTLLASETFHMAVNAGVHHWVATGAGGVVAFACGLVLAEYETAAGFGGQR